MEEQEIVKEIEELKTNYKELQKQVTKNELDTSVKLAEIQGDTTKIREILEKDTKSLLERVEKLEDGKTKLVWSIVSAILMALLSLVVGGVK